MLIRKMLRDMKLHKAQFISIFIMAFLGVFIYTGVGGEWYGLDYEAKNFYKETNFANIWLYGTNFTKEDSEAVNEIKTVTDVERRVELKGTADFKNNPDFTIYFLESNKISKNRIVKGEVFSQKDGVWIDSLFAKEKGLKVGNTFKFETNGLHFEKKILGFVMNPEHVYSSHGNELIPNHNDFGYAYLSIKAMPKGINLPYNELLITTKNESYSAYEQAVSKVLDGKYSVFLSRKNHESYTMFTDEIKQHKAMGGIFPVTFLMIALLTILTTMTRMVNNHRTQIGTLRALGFKKKAIILHYVSYGFCLSLLGALLGAFIGPKTLPYLFYTSMKQAYNLPQYIPRILPNAWIMVFVMVLLCTLINYLACRSILSEQCAQSLRPKIVRIKRQSYIEKTRFWAKLGFSLQWNFRDIIRSKTRSIMGIIGIVGCMGLLVCSFGMREDLKNLTVWLYEDINQYKSIVHLSEKATKDQIDAIKSEIDGEGIQETAIEVKANGKKKTATVLVADDVSLIKYTDVNQKEMKIPHDGIMLTNLMAKELKVSVGDSITWHLFGDNKWVTTKIDAINRNPTTQGITLEKSKFNQLGYQFVPTSFVTNKKTKQNMEGVSSIQTVKQQKNSYLSITETMSTLTYVLVVAAITLAVVVLYNLGVLSYTEKEKELATLKVLGFKTGKVRSLLLAQNVIISVIGIIPGIWFGKELVAIMLKYNGDSMDMMNIISLKNIFLSMLITMSMSILTNLLFSKKLKKIDMVSALKGIE